LETLPTGLTSEITEPARETNADCDDACLSTFPSHPPSAGFFSYVLSSFLPKDFRNYFPYKETQRDADTGRPALPKAL
jgi:hypothetical protein